MGPTVTELVSRNDRISSTHEPLPTFKENAEAGVGPPRVAIISCADPRVTPETYCNLGVMEAVILRNVGGHPQSCWKDIVALDAFQIEFFKNSGFEQLIVVHHTGMPHSLSMYMHLTCRLTGLQTVARPSSPMTWSEKACRSNIWETTRVLEWTSVQSLQGSSRVMI